MSSLAAGYDAMRVEGRSPDRSVTVVLDGYGDFSVTLADDVVVTHTEAELGRQIAGAARIAIAAFQQEQQRIIDQAVEEAQAGW